MPQRQLRPQLIASPRWNKCDYFTQSLFVRLITLVDDYGRYEADPEVVRSLAFPRGHPNGTQVDLNEMATAIQTLAQKDMLSVYMCRSTHFLCLHRWNEKQRSKSRYPDPAEGSLLSVADICRQLLAPTSTSTSTSTSPTSGGAGRCLQVELPDRFPVTIDDAIARAGLLGCTREFVMKSYEKAVSRGGRDAKDIPIRSWEHWLAIEWKYERARLAQEQSTKRKNGPNL